MFHIHNVGVNVLLPATAYPSLSLGIIQYSQISSAKYTNGLMYGAIKQIMSHMLQLSYNAVLLQLFRSVVLGVP